MAVVFAPDILDARQMMPLMLNAGTSVGLSGPPFDVTDENGAVVDSGSDWPAKPDNVPLPFVDTGAFAPQLTSLMPAKLQYTDDEKSAALTNPDLAVQLAIEQRKTVSDQDPAHKIQRATYRTTQISLTKYYDMVEQRYRSFMDVANFEPLVPSPLSRQKRHQIYAFTKSVDEDPVTGDKYPPHLNLAGGAAPSIGPAGGNQDPSLSPAHIFDQMRMAQLAALLPAVVPREFAEDPLGAVEDTLKNAAKSVVSGILSGVAALVFGQVGNPSRGLKIADVEHYNTQERQRKASFFHHTDIFDKPNIGDLPDWFTDARFAQQHFTGTNPTTITREETVIKQWIDHFVQAATVQKLDRMKSKLVDRAAAKSLYVQDYSYFRRDAGLAADAEMSYTPKGDNPTTRYAIASVCIFNLQDDGKLHPLGIVIDWRGTAEKSVTIFNKKLEQVKYEQRVKDGRPVKSDQEKKDDEIERNDWPWRYAKTCVQTSDWLRHEVTVHLTNTHLIEEATIVAANRAFEMDHGVYKLLYPHWQKTLSLNAAARATLVPSVIVPIVGMPDAAVYKFIRSAYTSFKFEDSYAPKDLERRGFPVVELDSVKFHNYAWARCIHSMWYKIRKYVEDMLGYHYGMGESDSEYDEKVKNDEQVQAWVDEMKNGAKVSNFPNISTFQGLVDAVTMCIHLASPQHTSVNYLQNFYQAFVINKPPALYNAPPKTLQQLQAFTETDLVMALPMNRPQEWLLASHIPYLLSYKPGDKESLIIYATSKWALIGADQRDPSKRPLYHYTGDFYGTLANSEAEFKKIGADCDDSKWITYDVLSPSWNAVSILI